MTDQQKVIKGLESQLDDLAKYADSDEVLTLTPGQAKTLLALLKEQEAVKPKTGHWIFDSQYCEAWSHTCSECGKRMTTAVNTFANWCWNCGAKMERR